MKHLLLAILTCVFTSSALANSKMEVEQAQEIRENLEMLLESVDGLTPKEVQDIVGEGQKKSEIQASTPAAAVIAGMAAAAYAAGTIVQEANVATSQPVADEEFDVKFQEL